GAILQYKAEAPWLIRHTTPLLTTNINLHTLKQFLEDKTDLLQRIPIHSGFPIRVDQRVSMIDPLNTEGDRLVAAYVLLLWPGLERKQLLKWTMIHTDSTKGEIRR